MLSPLFASKPAETCLNHRITECLGLEGTSVGHLVQPYGLYTRSVSAACRGQASSNGGICHLSKGKQSRGNPKKTLSQSPPAEPSPDMKPMLSLLRAALEPTLFSAQTASPRGTASSAMYGNPAGTWTCDELNLCIPGRASASCCCQNHRIIQSLRLGTVRDSRLSPCPLRHHPERLG